MSVGSASVKKMQVELKADVHTCLVDNTASDNLEVRLAGLKELLRNCEQEIASLEEAIATEHGGGHTTLTSASEDEAPETPGHEGQYWKAHKSNRRTVALPANDLPPPSAPENAASIAVQTKPKVAESDPSNTGNGNAMRLLVVDPSQLGDRNKRQLGMKILISLVLLIAGVGIILFF